MMIRISHLLAILVVVFLGLAARAQESRPAASAAASATNLKKLGTALAMYAAEYNDAMPPTMEDLVRVNTLDMDGKATDNRKMLEVLAGPGVVVPAEVVKDTAEAQVKWLAKNGQVVVLGLGEFFSRRVKPESTPLAYELPSSNPKGEKLNVLYFDGHVAAVDRREVEGMVAPAALDFSTPKATLRTYIQLVLAGDLDAMEKCCEPVSDPRQLEILRYMTESENFSAAVARAAADKFGEEKAKDMMSALERNRKFLGALDQYEEKITGDDAQLVPASADAAGPGLRLKPMKLRKVNGQWRLVIMLKVMDDAMYQEQRIAFGKAEREMIARTLKEIREGKFATMEELTAALAERRKALPEMLPGTQPATVHEEAVKAKPVGER